MATISLTVDKSSITVEGTVTFTGYVFSDETPSVPLVGVQTVLERFIEDPPSWAYVDAKATDASGKVVFPVTLYGVGQYSFRLIYSELGTIYSSPLVSVTVTPKIIPPEPDLTKYIIPLSLAASFLILVAYFSLRK